MPLSCLRQHNIIHTIIYITQVWYLYTYRRIITASIAALPPPPPQSLAGGRVGGTAKGHRTATASVATTDAYYNRIKDSVIYNDSFFFREREKNLPSTGREVYDITRVSCKWIIYINNIYEYNRSIGLSSRRRHATPVAMSCYMSIHYYYRSYRSKRVQRSFLPAPERERDITPQPRRCFVTRVL